MSWWGELLAAFLGCPHRRMSVPLTPKASRRTYVVCLECGKEFEYSWKEMKVGRTSKAFYVERSKAEAVPLTGTGEIPRT
jgi:hypothetical protein